MLWLNFRTTGATRFRIPGLFIFAAAVTAIAAIAALVPFWGYGGGPGTASERVLIEAHDETTGALLGKVQVTLTSRVADEETTQHGITNDQGTTAFSARCDVVLNRSLLRTWKKHETAGWSLERPILRVRARRDSSTWKKPGAIRRIPRGICEPRFVFSGAFFGIFCRSIEFSRAAICFALLQKTHFLGKNSDCG